MLRQQVASAVLWSAVRNWGSRLAGFAIFFLLVRLLTPDELGAFAAAFAIFTFLELFVDQGLSDALVQRSTLTAGQINAAFLINLAMALGLIGVLWATAPLIEASMGIPRLADILRIGSLWLAINALGFCQFALFRRELQYKRLALRGLAATLAGGVVGIAMALHGYGVWSLVGQLLTSASVNLLVLWYRPLWKPSRELNWSGLGQLSRYGLNVLGVRVIDFGGTRFVELAIGAWLGAASLGLFAVGSKIHYIMLQLLGSVLLDVALAGFSRIASDRARLQQAYYDALTVTAFVAVPGWIFVAAAAPELSVIAFGARWQASAEILMPLALLGALQTLQYYNGSALSAMGRPSLPLLLVVVRTGLVLAVLFAAQGAPLMTLVYGYVLAHAAAAPFSFWLARRYLGISIGSVLRRIGPFVAGAGAMGLAVFGMSITLRDLGWTPIAVLLLKAAVAALVYGLALLLVGRAQLRVLVQQVRALRRHKAA